MRKLLLATVAGLGVSMGVAGYADAQTTDDETSGQSFPTPGTLTVRLNGRFRFYAGFISGQREAANSPAAVAGSVGAGGTNKVANYGFLDYVRLYPGFDGVAANGLKYGASVEIRSGTQVNAGPGGGINGSISGQDAARSSLFIRREWGYFGTDKLGTIRLGSTDSPTGLYTTGTFENFNDGNWNGDVFGLIPSNLQVVWPFPDTSAAASTTKAIYLSPQFYGFDFGVSFEPNTGNASATGGACAIAGPGCDLLSATPTLEYQRRRNTFDGLIRYRGTFGPVGLTATAGYQKSGTVADNATPRRAVQFDGLKVGDFGLAVTFAGFQVGGHVDWGRFNGGAPYSPTPRGAPDSLAWIAGATYTIGPVIVGGSYFEYNSPGYTGVTATAIAATNPTGERRERGIAAGGTYSVAPGFAIYLSYLLGQRKESGFNFITGAPGTANNKVQAQVLALGTSFAW